MAPGCLKLQMVKTLIMENRMKIRRQFEQHANKGSGLYPRLHSWLFELPIFFGGLRMRPIVRERILEKFKRKCCYCGSTSKLEIDHIIPLSKGGRHDENNFQVLCRSCNAKKKDKFDYDKFFKKGDGKEYMLISNELADYLKHIPPHELQVITEHFFNIYCPTEGR